MNKQEIFDKVWEHAQKKEKSESGVSCLYRGPNGTKCFLGCLIPDDKYETAFDTGFEQLDLILETAGILEHRVFALTLQGVHDGNEPEEWNRLLAGIAVEFGCIVTGRAES